MTDHKRQAITAKLVELGFWGYDAPADSAGDYHDAKTLHEHMGAKLAGATFRRRKPLSIKPPDGQRETEQQ